MKMDMGKMAGDKPMDMAKDKDKPMDMAKDKDKKPDAMAMAPAPPNDTFTLTFDTPGTYEYVCLLHPPMRATITVVPNTVADVPSQADIDALAADEDQPVFPLRHQRVTTLLVVHRLHRFRAPQPETAGGRRRWKSVSS